MSGRFINGGVPDALLALQLKTGSAVLPLEVDEGTEHGPVIRAKLARYAEAIDGREDGTSSSSSVRSCGRAGSAT